MDEQCDHSPKDQSNYPSTNTEQVNTPCANSNANQQTGPSSKRFCVKGSRLNLVFAGIVAMFTIALTYVSYNQWEAMQESNSINRSTMIANTRAWLTPTGATLLSPIQTGSHIKFVVSFGNVGKEPALGFVAKEEFSFIDAPQNAATSWYTVFNKSFLSDICENTNASDEGSTFYPSGLRDYSYGVSTDMAMPVEMLQGTRIFYIHGCFAYKSPVTFDSLHKSEYCFMLIPDDKTGFHSASCPYGNNAS